ncbi:Arylsulfatase precursor [Posidoniimonas polymericola]|uniref:Arylsulfatase n=1 Tax=Posidoniimonas polymericola TaxID=2528002 RepID=A0A5C5YSE5_9BACT|nr:sulfatase-like hydrolase/transferase [Posidoniimonas polymericola]TWT77713.1 Arylsulfatase precursor [Posidoniimonas polymericola]
MHLMKTHPLRLWGTPLLAFPALALPLLTIGLAAPAARGQIKPNFVVILSDDQGWNGLSTPMDPNVVGPNSGSDFYETPNLAALATQGMRFRQAYAAAPNCSPTRASIQLGLNPASINLTDIVGRDDLYNNSAPSGTDLMEPLTVPRLPVAEVQSIAQRIKAADASYVTAHLGKWHQTTPAVKPSVAGGAVPYRAGDPSDFGYDVHDGARANNPVNSARDPKEIFSLSSRAIDFMDAHAGASGDNAPFYLQVSHYAVHDAPVTLPDSQAKYQDKLATNPGVVHPGGNSTDRVKYAGMTEDLDTGVGQILDYLANTPDPRNPGMMLKDTTYVIYTSDNGALLQNTNNLPLYDEKATSWEGGVRVPMIVRGPGVAANTVSAVPVVSTDLYATVTSLAGSTAPLPKYADSADFSSVLHNGGELASGEASLVRGSGANGEIFIHFPHYVRDTTPMSSMVEGDGSFKFVRIYGVGGASTDYLFDLNRTISGPNDTWETIDPADARNLANNPAYAGQLASMQTRFDAWVQTSDASLPYEIAAPVDIRWNASDNSRNTGFEGPAWRSVTDVDNRPREQMLIETNRGSVELVEIDAQGLGSHAYRFSCGGGLLRSFFHVSEDSPNASSLTITPDTDDSASFEFWFRSSDLDNGQVLLESGGGARGLSITLGGGDANPEVRLRLADNGAGKALVTTASLADADVFDEFVHLVAVVDETDAGGQIASLYVNGVLASQSHDVIGGGNVDWDGPGNAGIGMVATVLGGINGPGLAPFGTAGFEGDLARFSFLNTALTPEEVAARFAAVPEPTSAAAAAVGLLLICSRRRR